MELAAVDEWFSSLRMARSYVEVIPVGRIPIESPNCRSVHPTGFIKWAESHLSPKPVPCSEVVQQW